MVHVLYMYFSSGYIDNYVNLALNSNAYNVFAGLLPLKQKYSSYTCPKWMPTLNEHEILQ